MLSLRNFYLFFVLSLFVFLQMSCSSELIVQKDPSSPTLGDYKVTGSASYTINGQVSSSPMSGTLSIYAGESEDSFYFLEKTNISQRGYLTKWVGSTFTVEAVYDNNTYQYVTYYAKQSGGGSTLAKGQIQLDRYVNTTSTVVTSATGDKSSYTIPIKKHVSIAAKK